jgi:hypothetical protein
MFVQGSLASAGTLLIGKAAMGKETNPEVLLQHLDEYLFPKFPIVGPGAPPWSLVLHPKMIEALQTYRADRLGFGWPEGQDKVVQDRECALAGQYYESAALGAYTPCLDEFGNKCWKKAERGYFIHQSELVPTESLCEAVWDPWPKTGPVLLNLSFRV